MFFERPPTQNQKQDFYKEKIKKAREIYDLIGKEKLCLANTYQLVEHLRKKDARYAHLITLQQADDGIFREKKFFKFLTSKKEYKRDKEAFLREIFVTDYLANNTTMEARKVESYYAAPAEKKFYAMMETLPQAQNIGFMEKAEDMEKLTKEHARQCIENITRLRCETKEIPADLKNKLQESATLNSYEGLYNDIKEIVNQKVCPLDNPEGEAFYQTMARRLGIDDFKNRVLEIVKKYKTIIKNSEGKDDFLVHGDLSPRNMYIYDDGGVEFLDWEWASKSKNEILAMVYDYGNLRARAWNNKEFREGLDEAIFAHYKDDSEKAKAIVSLGILRSHCSLAGFFEDYDQEKQRQEQEKSRRENTEQDIRKAFEIAGIKI